MTNSACSFDEHRAIIGAIVVTQMPGPMDMLGVLLVMAGVAVHKPALA